MHLRLGNLTVREFAERVDADFTDDELTFLESYRTDTAEFADQSKFHIFADPAISIVIGSDALDATLSTWTDANARKTFNRPITFFPCTRSA